MEAGSLAGLATELDGLDAGDGEVVLVVPRWERRSSPAQDELIEAAQLFGGICVAASPVPLASPGVAWQVERAVAEATGSPVLRCHPHPGAMVGPVGAVRSLLAALVGGGSDADRMTEAVLSGRHDVVLDISSQFFHVLDGTGTDVDMVAGRARVGDEQPLVLIDPIPDARDLGEAESPERRARLPNTEVGPPGAGRTLHAITAGSLAGLAIELDRLDAGDGEVVLVVPSLGAKVVAGAG